MQYSGTYKNTSNITDILYTGTRPLMSTKCLQNGPLLSVTGVGDHGSPNRSFVEEVQRLFP